MQKHEGSLLQSFFLRKLSATTL